MPIFLIILGIIIIVVGLVWGKLLGKGRVMLDISQKGLGFKGNMLAFVLLIGAGAIGAGIFLEYKTDTKSYELPITPIFSDTSNVDPRRLHYVAWVRENITDIPEPVTLSKITVEVGRISIILPNLKQGYRYRIEATDSTDSSIQWVSGEKEVPATQVELSRVP
ncbi:MAG: hypothetical protein L0196_09005 [candidate division Zixibacteria bacterium]|nr:hypothetical protein [candidate division Zixibacteria bacterium]